MFTSLKKSQLFTIYLLQFQTINISILSICEILIVKYTPKTHLQLFILLIFQFIPIYLPLQKFMAFVYRSQKSSPFETKTQQISSCQSSNLNNQQSQLNGNSYDTSPKNNPVAPAFKFMKGLPSLLGKQNHKTKLTQKQNIAFYNQKRTEVRIDPKKYKKIAQNYVFSSKVIRDQFAIPFKQINKNLTCNQFNANNQPNPLFQQKKPPKQIPFNTVVNRSILNTSISTQFSPKHSQEQFKKQSADFHQIMVNCSQQSDKQIKRKSSPPTNIDKSTHHSLKITAKMPKGTAQNNIQKQKSQIFMKTSFKQDILLQEKPNDATKKPAKLHKANLQSSFYKQSQSQDSGDEYTDDVPGPGAYDNLINLKQKKSFRSRKQKFTKIFVSPLERFKTQAVKYQEVTYVNQDKPEKVIKDQTFLTKSPKFQPLQKRSESPPLGTYNLRQSIEHDVVRNLLKNANIPNFSSTLPRFSYANIKQSPGPGQYDIDSLQKARLEELRNQKSFCYKSQVKRCLQNVRPDYIKEDITRKTEIQLLADRKLQRAAIHQRQQHFESSQFFTAPPFLSGVERFNEPLSNQRQQNSQVFPMQSFSGKKQIQSNQPFNSSSKRSLQKKIGEGVGVGSYMIQKDLWNKKSYNLYFH